MRFRKRGSKKWLTMNELKAQGDLQGKYVEVATSNFFETRQSQPSEFFWDDRGKGNGFRQVNANILIVTIIFYLLK